MMHCCTVLQELAFLHKKFTEIHSIGRYRLLWVITLVEQSVDSEASSGQGKAEGWREDEAPAWTACGVQISYHGVPGQW